MLLLTTRKERAHATRMPFTKVEYTCICIHVYICMYIYSYTHIYIHVYAYMYIVLEHMNLKCHSENLNI